MVLGGRDDDITRAELELWAEVTTGQTDIHLFPGGHFFLFDCVREVT
jgi:surfactin synthase thioesterase subunit